jgi:hypothetical protein
MFSQYKLYRQRQAGRIYEYFIAQTLRQDGWEVVETGRNGIHDHGIDLIASKEGVQRYVQCKGWKRNWIIHEDVVSHLLGSVAAIEGIDNLRGVEKYLYSPAQLDGYAGAEADRVDIHFVRLDYPRWPRRFRNYRPFRRNTIRYSG